MTWDDVPLMDGDFGTGSDGNWIQGTFCGSNHAEVGSIFERDQVIGASGAKRPQGFPRGQACDPKILAGSALRRSTEAPGSTGSTVSTGSCTLVLTGTAATPSRQGRQSGSYADAAGRARCVIPAPLLAATGVTPAPVGPETPIRSLVRATGAASANSAGTSIARGCA